MKTRLSMLLVLAVAAFGLSACEDHTTQEGETEGVYVTVDGLQYQVQISRQLNPSDLEDREYLYGLRGAEARLGPRQEWFAVFVRVKYKSDDTDGPIKPRASRFRIEDTTGAEFEPVALTAEANPHAYVPGPMKPKEVFPTLDVTAGSSTTQGAMLLFKVTQGSLDNRPLELHIESPRGGEDAVVDLDI